MENRSRANTVTNDLDIPFLSLRHCNEVDWAVKTKNTRSVMIPGVGNSALDNYELHLLSHPPGISVPDFFRTVSQDVKLIALDVVYV